MIDYIKLIEIEQADETVLYKKVLHSKACQPNTPDSLFMFSEMMRLISSNSDICKCGPIPPDELSVKHDGDKWIFTFKALYDKKKIV